MTSSLVTLLRLNCLRSRDTPCSATTLALVSTCSVLCIYWVNLMCFLSVCVWVCLYVCVCMPVYVYICVCMSVPVSLSICLCLYLYVSSCMFVCISVSMTVCL